jgi:chromosome segregation ATPase
MSSQDVENADLWEQSQVPNPEYVAGLERELSYTRNENQMLDYNLRECVQVRDFYRHAYEQEKARVADLQASVAFWNSNANTLNGLVETQAAKVTKQEDEMQTLTSRVATLEAALAQAEKEKADYEKKSAYCEKVVKTQETKLTQYLETIRHYQTTANAERERNEQIQAESMHVRREYFALLNKHKELEASTKPPGA